MNNHRKIKIKDRWKNKIEILVVLVAVILGEEGEVKIGHKIRKKNVEVDLKIDIQKTWKELETNRLKKNVKDLTQGKKGKKDQDLDRILHMYNI